MSYLNETHDQHCSSEIFVWLMLPNELVFRLSRRTKRSCCWGPRFRQWSPNSKISSTWTRLSRQSRARSGRSLRSSPRTWGPCPTPWPTHPSPSPGLCSTEVKGHRTKVTGQRSWVTVKRFNRCRSHREFLVIYLLLLEYGYIFDKIWLIAYICLNGN